jgi:hypothetical protein
MKTRKTISPVNPFGNFIYKHWISLLAGMMAVFCCSIARAQINYTSVLSGGTLIYSNAFNGGAVNIFNTTPNYAVSSLGGSASAIWYDAVGAADTGDLLANGVDNSTARDSWLLPFTPQSGQVYTLTVTVTFTGSPGSGNWVGPGFAQLYSDTVAAGQGWYVGTPAGLDWIIATENTGNVQVYAGPKNTIAIINQNNFFTANSPATHRLQVVLDTTGPKWIMAAFMDGVQAGANYTYLSNPSIAALGLTQAALSPPTAVEYTNLILSAAQLIITKEPVSASVNQGAAFTNTVLAAGIAPLFYQWFTNGVPIADATNASLIMNPVLPGNAGTDYYVVVTNSAYGAVTSTPASLVVYTVPQFLSANPVTYTNLMTLFGGSGSYLGSSPSFSVNAAGLQPLTYYWLTNGVAAATGATFGLTNCQLGSPTNFTCIASNSLSTATNVWIAQYIPTPTAPYPQLIIADGPAAYWRLDETNYDPNQFNDGEVCNDFMSGNNGFYTNTALFLSPGYYVIANGTPITNDPSETAAAFGPPILPSEAYSIGTNVDFSALSNTEFTVSVWANGGYVDAALNIGNTASEPVNSGMVAKGLSGSEEFALDDGGSGGTVRFLVRNAAGTASSAVSTTQLGGHNTWVHLVGVCDESNGVANLYVNGLLTAQATISKGSGVEPDASLPITIGADAAQQFNGALDDVAIFPYAMNAVQVNALYQAAGGVNPLTFTAPLPPTNVVWRQNTTLTIPATALGTPPLGYYWTNLTVGGSVSGTGVKGATGSSGVSSLTCTLTITNAPPSWSGDQLELVVTNAQGSTNLFVTLFSYPPPVTVGYTNSILYSNEFNGGTWNLAGTATTLANSLVGGTNSTWTDAMGTNDTGSLLGSGLDNSTLGDSWLLPFTPHPGYLYTETAVLTFYGGPGNWVGLGFAQTIPTNAVGSARMGDADVNGYDWILLVNGGTANVEWFGSPGTPAIYNANNSFAGGAGTHTVTVVLDTTAAQWAISAYVDGVQMGPTTNYTSNPTTITGAGLTQNALTAPNNVQWNSWSLTAVSPDGFPPYLLNPLPPTSSILLTNATVNLNATGYGTGPWGYYWINNSTPLTSGTTNNTAPDIANLSIASSSLAAGQLELVLTNALGTNITIIPLVSPINANPTNIVATMTNSTLYLTWPVDHTGWQLQAQTNSVGVGISTNWANYNPSTGTHQVAIPINPANGTVFYRLMYLP